MIIRIVQFFFLLFFCVAPLAAHETLEVFLSQVEALDKQGILDGEVLVAKGDTILFHRKSHEAALYQEPQFMIASVSKQFYATALLNALYETSRHNIDEVKRKLHLPLARYLPKDAPIWSGHIPKWAYRVTPHQLLTHTSGIIDYFHTKEYEYENLLDPQKKFFEEPHTKQEMIKLVLPYPLEFTPGSDYAYCNTGYLLIAELLETITHEPTAVYLQRTLFDPLGMSNTFEPVEGNWHSLKKNPRLAQLVPEWKYDPTGPQRLLYTPQHFEDIRNAVGASSFISTSHDLLRWNLALHRDQKVLAKPLYTLLTTDYTHEYGYGIEVVKSEHGRVFKHGGSIETYRTDLVYFPDEELSIIVLSHIAYDDDMLEMEWEQRLIRLEKSVEDFREQLRLVENQLREKYPPSRGFGKLVEMVNTLVE